MQRKYSHNKPPSQATNKAVAEETDAAIFEFKHLLQVHWIFAVQSGDNERAEDMAKRYGMLEDARRIVLDSRL